MVDSKSPILFLFAHQDDEFGIFFEIHELVSRGEKIIIMYLTSGDASGNSNSIRDNESICVLKQLGIDSENIHFVGRELNIPDGSLIQHINAAYRAVSNVIDKEGVPNQCYFLAWEGGHQDHDAVHLIGVMLAQQFNIIDKCFQFPLYTGDKLPWIFFKLFSPLQKNGELNLKKIPWKLRFKFISYCFYYRSQKKAWLGLFPFFVLHYLFFGTQILQTISLGRIFEPPHAGKLLYERRGFYSQNKFEEEARCFLNDAYNKPSEVKN